MSAAGRQPHFLVIGSGPSGAAAAAALLEAGARVTMTDIGAELSAATRARAQTMAASQPSGWSTDDRAWLTGGLAAAGIPLKSLFGETFMYARGGALPSHFAQWPGQATGGFSRVWGATLGRFGDLQLHGWPLDEAALRPHYEAAEHLLGAAGPAGSQQARLLLRRWQDHAAQMQAIGVQARASNLAVSPDCKRCGMCLHGCPYGYIFSAGTLLEAFRGHPGFSYRPGLTVDSVAENVGGVTLAARGAGDERVNLTGDRVLVAAGPLGSARLMLASFGAGDTLTLQDSQYFLLPFLSPRAAPREDCHTLAQIFLELKGDPPLHVQLYGQNDIYGRAIAARLGGLARPLANRLGRHFLMAQGYLPSSHSGSALLSLDGAQLRIAPRLSPRTWPALRAAWRRLGQAGRLAGLHAVAFLAREAEIGRGYHSGGTMAMARQPRGWQSDLLGRVKGLSRVHVVDASVWPDIPSGPVTLTAMANAHRIACAVVELAP